MYFEPAIRIRLGIGMKKPPVRAASEVWWTFAPLFRKFKRKRTYKNQAVVI